MVTEVATPTAPEFRRRLVAELTAEGAITTDAVARAMLAVPRELFAPAGTDLAAVYAGHGIVITKRRPDGRAASSVSAPWLQARMLEQAQTGPGSRVLEIGSGGYNAALIAEIVGPTGRVVSLDIDADVVAAARNALTAAGYPQVHVFGVRGVTWRRCDDHAPGDRFSARRADAGGPERDADWSVLRSSVR